MHELFLICGFLLIVRTFWPFTKRLLIKQTSAKVKQRNIILLLCNPPDKQ